MVDQLELLEREQSAADNDLLNPSPANIERQRQTIACRGAQLKLKYDCDFVLAAIGLALLLPLFALIALLIKLTSRGPVLFRQDRVGQDGVLFEIFKFRTMIPGSDALRARLLSRNIYPDGRLFKLKRDPRVTRLGKILRKTSLDELPQLINVLKGEMSLVGPRPPLPSEVEFYERHHMTRFLMRPGITGPWQIAGRNLVTDFETVIALENEYMAHWGMMEDLRILLMTIPAVLLMRGAH